MIIPSWNQIRDAINRKLRRTTKPLHRERVLCEQCGKDFAMTNEGRPWKHKCHDNTHCKACGKEYPMTVPDPWKHECIPLEEIEASTD